MKTSINMKDWVLPYQADQVQQYLPHRYPFLLVDRILEIVPGGDVTKFVASELVGTRVRGLKCVTQNEPFFAGHFPERKLMPGVLIIETAAQVACFAYQPYFAGAGVDHTSAISFLAGVNGAKFRRPVVPGDVIEIEARLVKAKAKMAVFETEIQVQGQKVFEAELLTALADRF